MGESTQNGYGKRNFDIKKTALLISSTYRPKAWNQCETVANHVNLWRADPKPAAKAPIDNKFLFTFLTHRNKPCLRCLRYHFMVALAKGPYFITGDNDFPSVTFHAGGEVG